MIHSVNYLYIIIRYFVVKRWPHLVSGSVLLQWTMNLIWILLLTYSNCFEELEWHRAILTSILMQYVVTLLLTNSNFLLTQYIMSSSCILVVWLCEVELSQGSDRSSSRFTKNSITVGFAFFVVCTMSVSNYIYFRRTVQLFIA